MENTVNQESRLDLIVGDEFEKALTDAANVRRNNLTSVKSRNKDNYSRFYELMLMTRTDIQGILDKRRKDRTDADNETVKAFKKETSSQYRQICQLTAPETLEDGEPTRIQKLVQKIAPIVKLLEYIGHNELEDEFKRYGITLDYMKLSDSETAFENENIENGIKEVLECGRGLRGETERNNDEIKTVIFETSVPPELRFDKNDNPIGLRSSDFCKLVDLKTKMLMAQSDDAREKADEKASDMAGQCTFDNARNSLIQRKLIELQGSEDS